MKKNKFIKNLYQTISFLMVILVFASILIIGYITSLKYETNNGWILLLIAIVLILLYFVVGFFWIFQILIIDYEGIHVKLFRKTIRYVSWDSVVDINYENVMRNPAYVIKIKNAKNLNLDSRKAIKRVLEYYGGANTRLVLQKMSE